MSDEDRTSASYTLGAGEPRADEPDEPTERSEPAPRPTSVGPSGWPTHEAEDDLEGYETSMSKLADRMKGWMAALLAAALIIPLGGWLVDEVIFRRGATRVEETAAAAVVDAVYLVRAVGCAGDVRTGSAFVLDVGNGPVVVTNRHVVEDTQTIGLRALGGSSSFRAGDVRLADGADVATLTLPDSVEVPTPLRLADAPTRGDDVRVVGFPAALPFTTAGAVTDVEGGRVLLDFQVDPGASGSPVVNADDEVVAQVYARTPEGTGVATASTALGSAVVNARPAPAC